MTPADVRSLTVAEFTAFNSYMDAAIAAATDPEATHGG